VKVLPATAKDFAWLMQHADCRLTSEAHGMKAVDAAGRLHGVVAFDSFTSNSCQAHMAVASPIAWRRLLPECFRFVFETLKLGVGLAIICSTNERSLRMVRSLGFRELVRIRDVYGAGRDMVVSEIRREDCLHWLDYGKRKEAAHGRRKPLPAVHAHG
jgi:hypothetical protein